jgi:ketosteroid isomerase-like protein
MNELTSDTLATRFLQRLADGDADAIARLFAEEIDWFVPGNTALPWTGHRSRGSDVASYFRTMWPHFVPGKSTSTLEQLLVAGDDAVVFATFMHTAASTGRAFQTAVAMHLEFVDGLIVKLHLYEDTWAVSNAFSAPDTAMAEIARRQGGENSSTTS